MMTHETDDRKHAYSKTWAGRSIDDRYKGKIESQASLIIFENPEQIHNFVIFPRNSHGASPT